MPYINPIPKVDGFKQWRITTTFTFSELEPPTKEEAIQGVTNVILKAIEDNDGKLPLSWIQEVK